MTISKLGTSNVIKIESTATVVAAAKLMRKHNIGNIVVVENEETDEPVGILTDRDIAVEIVANEIDPQALCVADVMNRDLLVLKNYRGIQEALDMMSAKGVRRAPIVNDANKIVGIASIDDLLILIADELGSLAKLVRKQIEN